MTRREFFGPLACALVWPRGSAAQTGKRPTIGFIGTTTSAAWAPWTAAFVARLRELGWIEGQTVTILYRWAEDRSERLAEIADEFVRDDVTVIVTSGSGANVVRAKTTSVPIVFALAVDPLGGGLVRELARPGGNVTGLSQQSADLAGKRLGLMGQILPRLRNVGVMGDPRVSQTVVEMAEVENAARVVGVDLSKIEISNAESISPRIEALRDRIDALYVCTGPLMNRSRELIAEAAIKIRLATVFSQQQYVHAGGLLSYGPDIAQMFRRAGDYVDKILRGAKPADLPVEQPTRFEFLLNLRTARALGLSVPATLLALADEVIE